MLQGQEEEVLEDDVLSMSSLNDLDFSIDDSSSSEEYEKVKRKPGDFTDLCLMGKSS
jgi:hypothetical protein